MEFARDNGDAIYKIKNYQNRCIIVNNHTYNYPILVMPNHLMAPWGPNSFESLKTENFEILLPYQPQVVLLGTGEKLCFPSHKLFSVLTQHNIGVEVMNTAAACRTYTLLMAEGRNVAAALLC